MDSSGNGLRKTLVTRLCGWSIICLAGCAAPAGHWPHVENVYDLDLSVLSTRVEILLQDAGWTPISRQPGQSLTVRRRGQGGHETELHFVFREQSGYQASFALFGRSDHRLNWLTLGVLGKSTRRVAFQQIEGWLQEWRQAHEPVPNDAAFYPPASPDPWRRSLRY